MIGSDSLLHYNNLYLIDTINSFNESLHLSIRGAKRKLTGENSTALWHKRLNRISRRRRKKLVSDEILDPLNFIDFDNCINCIKRKQTNKWRFEPNWTLDVLELIHIDICDLFPIFVWNGQ